MAHLVEALRGLAIACSISQEPHSAQNSPTIELMWEMMPN